MSKTLSTTDLSRMKQMCLESVTPEDIATKFGVAVSTVHYHKSKFRQEGLNIPSVKGKRPLGLYTVTPSSKTSPVPAGRVQTTFVINGTRLKLNQKSEVVFTDPEINAKVRVSKDQVMINF